jgi:metallo-beta-lactamase class B
VVAVDGQAIEFGGIQVMPVLIPGHTPGSLGLVFPVQDGGVTHMAALFGGTVLLPGRMAVAGLQQYLGSVRHFGEVTARMKVDVELQNHPIYDDIVPRLAQLKARTKGAANPFVVGTTGYQNFITVMRECVEAQLARRPPAAPASAPPSSR